MSISQQDLTVRLQLASCAYSELANSFANNLKYGRKCSIDNEKTLLLLNAYIELIECYKLNVAAVNNVNSSVLINLGYSPTSTILIGINGTAITPNLPIVNYANVEYIANLFNSLQSEIVLTATDRSTFFDQIFELSFSGPCNGSSVNVLYSSGEVSRDFVLLLENGICASPEIKYNNCISEEQLLSIFDRISKITGVCFQPIGFTYTPVFSRERRIPSPFVPGINLFQKTHL